MAVVIFNAPAPVFTEGFPSIFISLRHALGCRKSHGHLATAVLANVYGLALLASVVIVVDCVIKTIRHQVKA